MTSPPMARDNPATHQFEIDADGQLAIAQYAIDGTTITFTHTLVPEAARGRGLGTRLVEAGLAAARQRGLQVVPRCAMFAAYMKAHAETHDLVAPVARRSFLG